MKLIRYGRKGLERPGLVDAQGRVRDLLGVLPDISAGADVTTMHPIGGRQVGWDQVWGSWQQVAGIASGGRPRLKYWAMNTMSVPSV